MVKIDTLFKKRQINRVRDLEFPRYANFLENTYLDNLKHSEKNMNEFPRWSIISGYYAMHDITKLYLVRKFRIKIDYKVHKNTIIVLKELIKNKEIPQLLENAYKEFLNLASDLEEAKDDRVKAQYYTGSSYSHKRYEREADEFFRRNVIVYINKLRKLLESSGEENKK